MIPLPTALEAFAFLPLLPSQASDFDHHGSHTLVQLERSESYEKVEPEERAMRGVPFGRSEEEVIEGVGCFNEEQDESNEEILRGG